MKLSHPAIHTIYLAAPYGRKEELREYALVIEALGVEVTSRWLQEPNVPEDMTEDEWNRVCAQYDIEDINRARYVLSFTEPPTSTLPPRGGRHFEMGYALAKRKGVGVVGYRENIFHFLPGVEFFPTFEDALIELRGVHHVVPRLGANKIYGNVNV